MMEREEKEIVAFIKDAPQFVGLNLKNYGPFKKGDIVVLPKENAKLLIEKKVVEKIQVGD